MSNTSEMLGFMHRWQIRSCMLVFSFTTDCHTLQAIVVSQQQMSSREVPLPESFVPTQLLPRNLAVTGMFGVRMGLKGLAAIAVYIPLLCPD